MYETVSIPLVDLLLDTGNARLGDEQPSQQAVYLALAKQQGHRLVRLAENIARNGTDPTNLPAVVATSDRKRKYKVVEGNRRVLALKALDNPSIVSGALTPTDQKRLAHLSAGYAKDPVEDLTCVLFATEEDALHWVTLRHTGANDGAGLVEWDANEQDRFLSRHGQGRARKPAGQILDYLDEVDGPPETNTKVMTTLQRIIGTKEVRDALGVEVRDGQVVSHYPADELLKGLRRIVGDLRSQKIKVKNVYDADDRKKYVEGIDPGDLPDPSSKLKEPVPLDGLASGTSPAQKPVKKKKPAKPAPRTAVVPSSCAINPTAPRINAIYNELLTLDAETYPNACSVLLRVFLELSVDHEVGRAKLAFKQADSLAKRLKGVADSMESQGRIDGQLKKAMYKVADSKHTVAASTVNFNQYVHNQYVFPKPTELRLAWDEMQPFLEELWA